MEDKRGSWGSNFGFLMAAIGSAVGLGNIWGFPYKMGKGGGFAFLLIYILCVIFIGFGVMLGEPCRRPESDARSSRRPARSGKTALDCAGRRRGVRKSGRRRPRAGGGRCAVLRSLEEQPQGDDDADQADDASHRVPPAPANARSS